MVAFLRVFAPLVLLGAPLFFTDRLSDPDEDLPAPSALSAAADRSCDRPAPPACAVAVAPPPPAVSERPLQARSFLPRPHAPLPEPRSLSPPAVVL